MADVYSVSLLQLAGLSASTTFGPPAGYLWVVREIDVYANVSTGGDVVFFAEGTDGQTWYSEEWVGPSAGSRQWTGRVVIPNPYTLTVKASGGPVDVTVCGYALALP